MFKQIVLGLLFIGAGVAMTYYSAQIVEMMGRNDRAEKNLGGTRNAIVLFGFGLIVLGTLFMFGVLEMSSPTEIATSEITG
ncbi:MAG TPA: hypothetical protein VJ892_02525 [Candidatus Absconditabacterales bacterium]|nr:hypothetical protein [Candidatus Absconditabacterales bacterium]